MKNKSTQLQEAILGLKQALAIAESPDVPIPDFVRLYPNDARVLLEALESLRWHNLYRGASPKLDSGFSDFLEAKEWVSESSANYIETVGIIRIKNRRR
jgi:hypothetical protein